MKHPTMQFDPFSCYFLSLSFIYFPQHLFWNTLNLCSYLRTRDQVSHSSKVMVWWCNKQFSNEQRHPEDNKMITYIAQNI